MDRVKELEDFFELGFEEVFLKDLGKGYCLLFVGILYKIIYLLVVLFIIIIDIFDIC